MCSYDEYKTLCINCSSLTDAPQLDDKGNVVGINILVHENADSASESSFKSSTLSGKFSGEPYPGNPEYSIQSTNYEFADINGDGIQDLLEATFLYNKQRVPGYPLPQRVHFLDENGNVDETLVILEDGSDNSDDVDVDNEDAGRSVNWPDIF